MATLIDLLRLLGQHAAPDGSNALAGPVVLPGVSDPPLALAQPSLTQLVAAWSRQTGRITLGHHALALSAAQTSYSVALMGHGSAPHDDLLLLLLAQLQRQPQHSALCIIQQPGSFTTRLVALADTLGLSWLDAAQPGPRIRPAALVLATPNDLHRRVLQFHDRSWSWLWPRLQTIALPELQHAAGVAAGHLHWVLRRVARLRPEQRSAGALHIFSSLAPVAEAESTLTRVLPEETQQRLRIIAAPDGPSHSTLVALWRCGGERQPTIARLVEQLAARRVPVAVLGRDPAETEQLRAALAAAGGARVDGEARVAIVSGVPATAEARQALLRTGYRLLLLLAGDEPHELLYAAQPELLLQMLPVWPVALANPYISAAQLVCAATERPLEEAEIDRWQLRDLRDRLLKKGSLQPLPGSDLWQSTPEAADPYEALDLRTIGGAPAIVRAPDGRQLDLIAPTLLDRRALPGQVFASGLRVTARDEQAGTVQLALDTSGSDTIVLADVAVTIREEQAARTLHFGKITAALTKGKVLATQQIAGLRELQPDGSTRRLPLRAPAETQWSAAACWLELPTGAPEAEPGQPTSRAFEPTDPQTIGWSISTVLPLITLAPPGALITAYVADQQRLYLIEAEPGGIGLIGGVYEQFERIIQLAGQLTRACLERPLYARIAASEARWLRLLSPSIAQPTPAAPTPVTPTPPAPTPAAPTTLPLVPRVETPAPASAPRTPTILPFPTRRPAPERARDEQPEQPAAAVGNRAPAARRSESPSGAGRTRVYSGPRPAESAPIPPRPLRPAPDEPATPAPRPTPIAAQHDTPPEPPTRAPTPDQVEPQPLATAAATAPRHHAAIYPLVEQSAAAQIEQQPAAALTLPAQAPATNIAPLRPAPVAPGPPPALPVVERAESQPNAEPAAEIVEQPDLAPVVPVQAEPPEAAAVLAEPVTIEREEPEPDQPSAAPDEELEPEGAFIIAPDEEPEGAFIVAPDEELEPALDVETAEEQQAEIVSATQSQQRDELSGDQREPDERSAAAIEDMQPASALAQPDLADSDDQAADKPAELAEQPAEQSESLAHALSSPHDASVEDDAQQAAPEIVARTSSEVVEPAPAPTAVPVRRTPYDPTDVDWDLAEQPDESAAEPIELDAIAAAPDESPAPDQPPALNETAEQGRAEPIFSPPVEPEVEPAPPAALPSSPVERGREPPRRWQPAASAQFRIDDLLPPLDLEQEPDEIEQDEPEATERAALPPAQPSAPPTPNERRNAPTWLDDQADDDLDERPESDLRPGRATAPPAQFGRTQRNTPPNRPNDPRRDSSQRAQSPDRPNDPRRDAPGFSRSSGAGTRRPAPNQPPGRSQGQPSGRSESSAPPERGRPAGRFEPPPRRNAEPPREPPRATQPSRQPAPQPEPAADVGAMIERMRRLRQQREAEQQSTSPRSRPSAPGASADEPAELRFHIGERVQCLPYGVGRVRASRIVDGRELVQIEFPDYGEIEVDPAVSLVRQLGTRAPEAEQPEDE